MKQIIVYSKRDGINKLLKIDTNDLTTLLHTIDNLYPEEKDHAYALIDGIEIKLF